MPKITDRKLKLIQVRVFEDDYDLMQKYFCYPGGKGMNAAIRTMVSTTMKQMEARANSLIDKEEREQR